MSGTEPKQPRHTNKLVDETSPYLLQHAHNPVDWYPWGEEAFAAAREQDRPIFLSVGYSTCYWCHVMERQVFEDERIAALMNEKLICIKVDREERPDVDQLYMNAVQLVSGSGGWPMSVFLTPDGKPFWGGTYIPPKDMHGRPGFGRVVNAIDQAWRTNRDEIEQSAEQLTAALKQIATPPGAEEPIRVDRDFVAKLVDRSTRNFDSTHGGFGGAPKFPNETHLRLLLAWLDRGDDHGDEATELRSALTQTLTAMADGGIRDHLGGGFHRYSTDAEWLVPHFEIMLYNQAMLGRVYAEASVKLDEPRFATVARGVYDFVLREMTAPAGGFYTAFDAESNTREGESYLWTAEQVEQALGEKDAAIFNELYGLSSGPNFADPHHGDGTPDRNVLHLVGDVSRESDADVVAMRRKLKSIRDERDQPLLDTKIITSWCAMMIESLAYAGRTLDEPRYVDAAAKAADFLLAEHRRDDGTLWRTSRDGRTKYDAFLDDYAYLAAALLELHLATGAARWRDEAAALVDVIREKFATGGGGFYFTADDSDELIVRQILSTDTPLPSGNAVAARVLVDLDHADEARRTLAAFAPNMLRYGEGMSSMAEATLSYLASHEPFTVAADGENGSRPPTPEQIAARVVSIEPGWQSPTALRLDVRIADDFHLNANPATGDYIATEVLAADANAIERIDYPPGETRRFAFEDEEELSVYEGIVSIIVRFDRPPEDAPKLALRFQACDDASCLPPVAVPIDTPKFVSPEEGPNEE